MTRPTRLGVGTPEFPEDIDEMVISLAKLGASKNKALELNGKDILTMPDLVRRVAKACKVAKCRVSFGSDAHYPDQISRAFAQVQELVKEFGLQLIL